MRPVFFSFSFLAKILYQPFRKITFVKKLLAIFSIVTVVTSLSLYQFNFKEVNRDLKPKCRYEKNTKILNDTAFEMKVLDVPFSYAYGIGLDDFNGDGLKDISVDSKYRWVIFQKCNSKYPRVV